MQNDTNELRLLHWCNGLRISCNSGNHLEALEAIISLGFLVSSFEYDSIEIKVRSGRENRKDCFRLFYLLVNLIEQFINSQFPSLALQRSYYSPFELNIKRKLLYRYSTKELADCLFSGLLSGEDTAKVNEKSKPDEKSNERTLKDVLRQQVRSSNSDLDECLADIIACGIDDFEALDFQSDNFLVATIKEFFEAFLINNATSSKITDAENECPSLNESKDEILDEKPDDDFRPTLITEFKVNDLDVLTRQQLCALLDPPDQFGFDWCMLSIKLNLTEKLPILDSKKKPFTSPTWRLLEEFSKEPDCSLRLLLGKLAELNKKNAIELLLKSLPLIRIIPVNSKLRPLLAYADSFDSNSLRT